MNCEQARRLLDDHLEDQLNQYHRQQLEGHLVSCSSCVEELRARSALDQAIWQALAASVQHRTLTSKASARIVRMAQSGARQASWSNHALLALRVMASLATAALVLLGLFSLLDRKPAPLGQRPVTLLPFIQLALSELSPITLTPADRPTLSEPQLVTLPSDDRPALTLSNADLRVEPSVLRPSEWFTITLVVHSDLPQPLDTARMDLEVDGPQGSYRFPLAVEGPLPAPGVSILRVTPDNLDATSRKQYLMPPTDIFKEPGVYTVRVTLFSPIYTPER